MERNGREGKKKKRRWIKEKEMRLTKEWNREKRIDNNGQKRKVGKSKGRNGKLDEEGKRKERKGRR